MSKESTYIPKNGFAKWFDQRLPLPRMLHDNISAFPTPRNLNYWYTFGGILTFCLVTQIVTGFVLACIIRLMQDLLLLQSSTL